MTDTLQIADKKAEAEREGRKRERLEKEVVGLKGALEARNTDIKAKQMEVRLGQQLGGGLGRRVTAVRKFRTAWV